LELEDVRKSYGDHGVIRGFSAAVGRGERICLIGRNGQGKTTLLKAVLANAPNLERPAGEDPAGDIDGGVVKWGHEAQIGYFAQDHTSTIPKGTTAAEWLHSFDPKATREDVRGVLGQMLFSGEEGLKPTDALSGGEAARLVFCRLMMQKPNILVLDEPTNHLDLEAVNALNQALQKYEGTVLLVTHDQDLIDETATRIWSFEEGGIDDFKGPFAEFLQSRVAMAH
jgi:ATPase subunit of ABC transporter with duplicated ATPase domains